MTEVAGVSIPSMLPFVAFLAPPAVGAYFGDLSGALVGLCFGIALLLVTGDRDD